MSTHNVNRRKMLRIIHIYLLVLCHFHRSKHLVHVNSQLQFANTKPTSHYYLNYSHIINQNLCEGTLRNFDLIKNYFTFTSLYTTTHRQILVPIEYIQCVEGGATNCMYGHTFNLLYRDWIADKTANRELELEETQILNHLLEMQPHCNPDLYPRPPAACLARETEFSEFFRGPENLAQNVEFEFR